MTTTRTTKMYKSSWETDAPDITVRRSGKYSNLRNDLELLISGNSPTPFLTITADNHHRATLIAQHISQYRKSRKATALQYAQRGSTVHVWNETRTPMVQA